MLHVYLFIESTVGIVVDHKHVIYYYLIIMVLDHN